MLFANSYRCHFCTMLVDHFNFISFFRQFFTAKVFAKLLHTDSYGRISIMQFFNYVMRKGDSLCVCEFELLSGNQVGVGLCFSTTSPMVHAFSCAVMVLLCNIQRCGFLY